MSKLFKWLIPQRTNSVAYLLPGRSLVNCAALPRPKTLKKRAVLKLSEGELRSPLNKKDPYTCKGVQQCFGFDTKSYAPTGFASNRHNEEQALMARVLANTIEPVVETLMECIEWCKANHRALFPRVHNVQSVKFGEYLERSNASPSVKTILQRTYTKLISDGVTEHSTLARRTLYQYTYRSSFVKTENDLYESPLGRKHKAPRLIQGATPEFICLVGPWIMALQDIIKRRWNARNNLCFTSGMTADQAARFISQGSGKWVEDDLGKFDCSIRKPWCEYEVWLSKTFGAPRAVVDLMTANISTHGATHHGWRYKCEGTRKSGDPFTSLFNSIINGLSHLFLYCKWTSKSPVQAQDSIRMLVQGDDNCMRHLEDVCFPWQKGMAELGFDSEALYRESFHQVEFCSCRLYETPEGLTFGPKPGRVLAKFGYVINPPVNVSKESMMRGIALGLQASCSYIPPLKTVIERTLAITSGNKAWFAKKRHMPFAESDLRFTQVHTFSNEVMLGLNLQYEWDYGVQSRFDTDVAGMRFGDSMFGVAELLFDRDTGGPQAIFGGWVGDCPPAA